MNEIAVETATVQGRVLVRKSPLILKGSDGVEMTTMDRRNPEPTLVRVRHDFPKTSAWILAHFLWMIGAVIFYLVVSGTVF